MTKNVGPADRAVRILLAALLGFFAYMGIDRGWFADWFAIVLGAVAAYLMVTGLKRSCLVYRWLEMDSNNREDGYRPLDIET